MAQGKVTVHNKISPTYRQIHVDGAYGGATPRGLLNLSFYAERLPIPKATDFEIVDPGGIGNPIAHSEESKIGIVREYEMGIYMDINTAKSLANFILDKVAEIETITNSRDARSITK